MAAGRFFCCCSVFFHFMISVVRSIDRVGLKSGRQRELRILNAKTRVQTINKYLEVNFLTHMAVPSRNIILWALWGILLVPEKFEVALR